LLTTKILGLISLYVSYPHNIDRIPHMLTTISYYTPVLVKHCFISTASKVLFCVLMFTAVTLWRGWHSVWNLEKWNWKPTRCLNMHFKKKVVDTLEHVSDGFKRGYNSHWKWSKPWLSIVVTFCLCLWQNS